MKIPFEFFKDDKLFEIYDYNFYREKNCLFGKILRTLRKKF